MRHLHETETKSATVKRPGAHLPKARLLPRFQFSMENSACQPIVEAIYRPGALGVQWHPELMVTSDDEWMRLFRWFILGNLAPDWVS